jgi:hypothetical protein
VAELIPRGITRWHYDSGEWAQRSYGGVAAAQCSASAVLVQEGELEWERSGVSSRGATLLSVRWLDRPGSHLRIASLWHVWPDTVGHDITSVSPI